MLGQPFILELVEAVRSFIETKAMPELKGHTAFHARVAANALGIVARELEQGPKSAEAERKRLVALLGHDDLLDNLNQDLCKAIRDGKIDIASGDLKRHLELTTLDKVAIDQPGYSGLKIAKTR